MSGPRKKAADLIAKAKEVLEQELIKNEWMNGSITFNLQDGEYRNYKVQYTGK